jgi:uncharacterized membrane protein YccF (DUF307 family)
MMATTYGNNGNRWWVGLNVGSDNSTVFGTGSILSPNGYESLPSGNAADDAQFAAAASHNATASTPSTISVENVKWFNIRGPYATQAQANAAIAAIQKANPAPGEVQQVTAGGQSGAAAGGGVNFSSIQNALTSFYDKLTDGKMWRSLGWLLLGVLMILAGLALWLGPSALKMNPISRVAALGR